MENVEKLYSITVTQLEDRAVFCLDTNRSMKAETIIHPDVLSDPAKCRYTPLKSTQHQRAGYEIPSLWLRALTDDKAYAKWQEQERSYQLRSLKNQLWSGNNGNNSFIKHQIQLNEQIPCPYCDAVMRKNTLITSGGDIRVYECPKCKATIERKIYENKR